MGLADDKISLEEKIKQLNREKDTAVRSLQKVNRLLKITPGMRAHAILQYLSTVEGVDLAQIRGKMLTPENIALIKSGAHKVYIAGVPFLVDSKGFICQIEPTATLAKELEE